MFLSNYMVYSMMVLIYSSILALSMNSIFLNWVMMELNLLVVVPLLLTKSSFYKETSSNLMKYFLIQVLGSLILIVLIVFFNMSMFTPWMLNSVMIIVLMLKSGVPPLHFWLPHIMQYMTHTQAIIMLTLQKIIPLFLMSYFSAPSLFIYITMSSLIGGISGFNQNSMMKLMAYSSMVHFGWMMSSVIFSASASIFYFLVYSAVTVSLMNHMSKASIFYLSELAKKMKPAHNKMFMILILMTLSGFPPLVGFFSKIFVLKVLVTQSLFALAFILLCGSFISFYYYFRVIMISAISEVSDTKNKTKDQPFKPKWTIVSLNLMFMMGISVI